MALSRLVTFSISSLHNLDIEANKFCDRCGEIGLDGATNLEGA